MGRVNHTASEPEVMNGSLNVHSVLYWLTGVHVVSGSGVYAEEGISHTVTQCANAGYVVIRWRGGGGSLSAYALAT